MRAHPVVASKPILNNHHGFRPGAKPLHGEAFIPDFAVEALDPAILLGLAGINRANFSVNGQRQPGSCPPHRSFDTVTCGCPNFIVDYSAE